MVNDGTWRSKARLSVGSCSAKSERSSPQAQFLFGQHSLERALKEYVAHYPSERNHQGIDNQLIEPDEEVGSIAGKIECRERLGGMLKYYYRDAA